MVANLLYRDYWAACTLHIPGYVISSGFLAIAKQRAPKRVIFRVYLFYSYFGIGSIKHVSHRVLFTHRTTIFNIPVFIKMHGLTDNVMSQVVKACFLRTERTLVDILVYFFFKHENSFPVFAFLSIYVGSRCMTALKTADFI